MHDGEDKSGGLGLCFLLVVAMLILQASHLAKEQAAIMRYQVTKAEQSAAACRAKP